MDRQKILEHWRDMPEYDNVKEEEPLIKVTFKFKSREDFEEFNALVKKHVYKTNKVFNGRQTKNYKEAWYPLHTKANDYAYK